MLKNKRPNIKLRDLNLKETLAPNRHNLFVWLNAVFLIGLLIFGKTDALTIVIAYFLETVIIGIVYAFKMYTMISGNPASEEKYGTILFFLLHYSFFVVIQLIFVFSFLELKDSNIKSGLNLFHNISYVLNLKGMVSILISILIYNLAEYYYFIKVEVYKRVKVKEVFFQPYVRIIIQQFAVILSGFFIVFISGVFVVAILLIIIRTFIELILISNSDYVLSSLNYKNK